MCEYAAPTIAESRRLLGANRFHRDPGVLLEVEPAATTPAAVQRWALGVAALWRALGWPEAQTAQLIRPSSAQLFATAPVDGLMTATSASEWAWAVASGAADVAPLELLSRERDEERARLGAVTAAWQDAARRGLSASLDDDAFSVGSGAGAAVAPWPIPLGWSPHALAHDVPITLVTGSNGKTTTTRLVAAMWRAADRVTGWSSSDGVHRGARHDVTVLAEGDYTGPAGARLVLRDAHVQAAVLETARGGLLRRGLATTRAHVAVITNISADHFGEHGVESLTDLATVKGTLARVLMPPDGVLVLNADDAELVALAEREWEHERLDAAAERTDRDLATSRDGRGAPRVVWFATPRLDGSSPAAEAVARVHRGVLRHGLGAVYGDEQLRVAQHGTWHDLGRVHDMPITFGGAAHHNVANALAAALTAVAGGISPQTVAETLARFGGNDNAGRLMVHELGGVTVVLDYAHNPEGLRALAQAVASLPARRRLLLLGQAGDRDDTLLHALAAAAWQALPWDRVLLKDMPEARRGRGAGEITARLRDGLLAAGAPSDAIGECLGEAAGVREALTWAQPGDLLVLTVHVDRAGTLALLGALEGAGWRAGVPPVMP